MSVNEQNMMDSQLPVDGSFNLLTYIGEFVPGADDLQLANYIEVDAAEVLGTGQLNQTQLTALEVQDHKEPLYDVNIELSVDPLSVPGIDFQAKIAETGRNDNYTFSSQLMKVFTSTDKPCTFEMSCNSSSTNQLIVRVMMVCANMPFQPLSRCAYHGKNDVTAESDHVVIRRDGPAEYVGTPDGKTFRERLALKIPMGNTSTKSITLEFKCLSSCHKIKKVSTALVFTLEDPVAGQLLGREVIPIQISKNFKRDMETAEKAVVKRTAEIGQKRKQSPPASVVVDLDRPSGSSTASGGSVSVDLNLQLPPNAAKDFLKYAEQFFAAKLYGAEPAEEQELLPTLKKIRRIASDLEKPKDQ